MVVKEYLSELASISTPKAFTSLLAIIILFCSAYF
ncbi:Uncharacterised protein [Segatella copri]|nr:Uncharacterised protein [Segatella copri]